MKRLLFALSVLGVVAAWPSMAGASTFKGVVVAHEGSRVLVASPAGLVRAVSGRAAVGSRISMKDGRVAVVGRSGRARVRGVVVRRVGATMFLSSNRHLLAVDDSAPAPQPGDVVSSTVTIGANGQLDEDQDDDLGQIQNGTVQVQALVAAVGAGTVTLTVEGQSLTVSLPGGLTLPASLVGQTVTLELTVAGQNNDEQGDDDGGGDHGNHGGGGDGGGDH
jgi:hypothetical protein